MTTALQAPITMTAGEQRGPKLYRKQILKAGTIDYKGRKLTFDQPYLADLADSFNARAYDQVPFLLANEKNEHHSDPEKYRGEIKGMEVDGDGLYALVELTSDGQRIVTDNPGLPVSARIVEDVTRADGQHFPRAVAHVLGTIDPRLTGMAGWEPVNLTNDPDVPTVDLSAAEYDTKETKMPEKTSVWAKIGKALGLADDASDDDVRAKLVEEQVITDPPDGDEETLSAEEIAALEALANEPAEASLTAEAQQQIDLANANAEQAVNRAKALEAQAARSAWAAERTERLHEGIPAAVLDLAAPWCGGDAPTGFIDLANTDTTVESVRDAAAGDMRKMLDNFKGFIDLSVIGESADPDADAAEATARQEKIRAHRKSAGI